MNSDRRFFPRTARTAVFVVLLSALLACGCGGSSRDDLPRASVAGTVTLDGAPLPAGVIRFVPTSGTVGPQTTAVITNGEFSLPKYHGPVVGNHRVEIDSTDTGGLAMDDEQALDRLQAGKRPARIQVVLVPLVYNRNSHLTAVVPEEGASGLSFDLTTQPDG